VQTREFPSRSRASHPAGASRRWQGAGWVRCQVMGAPAELWTRARPDTEAPVAATTRTEDSGMLKKARNRATAILSGSASLYREMAFSALRLVRR
jgi:hypothetical protein